MWHFACFEKVTVQITRSRKFAKVVSVCVNFKFITFCFFGESDSSNHKISKIWQSREFLFKFQVCDIFINFCDFLWRFFKAPYWQFTFYINFFYQLFWPQKVNKMSILSEKCVLTRWGLQFRALFQWKKHEYINFFYDSMCTCTVEIAVPSLVSVKKARKYQLFWVKNVYHIMEILHIYG